MAIRVWSKSDPLKRQTAKENGLNWIEVFSMDVEVVIKEFINIITNLNN